MCTKVSKSFLMTHSHSLRQPADPDNKMSERSGLPPGWKIAESDGRLYCYSAYSNVVVWEKPTDPPPPPPPPPPGPPPRSPLVSEYDSQEEDIFR